LRDSHPGRNWRLKKPLTRDAARGVFTGFSFSPSSATSVHMSIEIKIRKNEPIDRALRRMKKKLDRENIIKGTRAKRYYEKPCEKRRRKEKVQAFTQMLRRRYAE
jgi:small subunit ribosomal protein S21